MKRFAPRATLAGLLLLLAPFAHAQAFRTYLASYGSDSNPCTVAQPCRLLPAALNAVAGGGETWILDSANFNPGAVNISKDVTILAVPGAVGSFAATASDTALRISGANVKLRNLVFAKNVSNPGFYGVDMTGGSLDVENSLFAGMNIGINAGDATVRVRDTTFRDGVYGIYALGTSSVVVSSSRFANISENTLNVQGAITTPGTI